MNRDSVRVRIRGPGSREPRRKSVAAMRHRSFAQEQIMPLAGAETKNRTFMQQLPAQRSEHAHARLAFDVVLPLIGVGVPVQLAHAAQLDLHQRRGDRLRSRKHTGIGDPHRSALGLERLLCQHLVAETLWYLSPAGDPIGAEWSRAPGSENIKLARIRNVSEG
jgi:hypothetical protein